MHLDLQADGDARAREADHDARAIGELHEKALLGRHAAIEVGIGEVVCFCDCAVWGVKRTGGKVYALSEGYQSPM
jgi:hypothetical protein